MNYFDRIPHFALFLGFRYAKCGKHGLLPGDDMADGGLKPWPDGETKNPEINALKKPQKTSLNLKVGKMSKNLEIGKYFSYMHVMTLCHCSVQIQWISKSWKKKFFDIIAKFESLKECKNVQKCPKISKHPKIWGEKKLQK